jgi:hypothetical protein
MEEMAVQSIKLGAAVVDNVIVVPTKVQMTVLSNDGHRPVAIDTP